MIIFNCLDPFSKSKIILLLCRSDVKLDRHTKFVDCTRYETELICFVILVLRVIHEGRPHQGGRGVCQMRTLLLIFTCKRPKYADIWGRGSKNGKILRTSFMNGPLYNCVSCYSLTFECLQLMSDAVTEPVHRCSAGMPLVVFQTQNLVQNNIMYEYIESGVINYYIETSKTLRNLSSSNSMSPALFCFISKFFHGILKSILAGIVTSRDGTLQHLVLHLLNGIPRSILACLVEREHFLYVQIAESLRKNSSLVEDLPWRRTIPVDVKEGLGKAGPNLGE